MGWSSSVSVSTRSKAAKAARWLKEQDQLLSEQQQKLEEMKLGEHEIKWAMDPLRSFRQQLAEEVES